MMSWITSVHLCMTLTWSDLNPACIILYVLQAACHWWSVRLHSCCDKQEVTCCACLNLSHLHYGCQHHTLAEAQHCSSPIYYWGYLLRAQGRLILGNVHLKFMVYDCKQVCMYVCKHTSAMQSSLTNVGLAQACPNQTTIPPNVTRKVAQNTRPSFLPGVWERV